MQHELEQRLLDLKKWAADAQIDVTEEIAQLKEKFNLEKRVSDAWKRVELARHIERPGTVEYIRAICDDFIELHGDRCYGDDPAMMGGVGRIDGRPVTLLGTVKGRNLKDNLRRNYGMAQPEGYRKALRLARQAEKFRRPIITFIDTPGAYPGMGSEERGIGEAIARNLYEFSHLRTPILCFVIGEGGSGGALGIGVGDKIYMLENAVYSVISPEGCASILLRDPAKAREAARMMKITSEDLQAFRIVDGVIPEPEGGAHANPAATAAAIRKVILRDLAALDRHSVGALVRYRNLKIRKIGLYHEGP